MTRAAHARRRRGGRAVGASRRRGRSGARRRRQPSPACAWPVRFVDVAREAGLTQPITYGDASRKRFIIETNGCGVAMIDLDDDGWVDLVTLNGTQLEPGSQA